MLLSYKKFLLFVFLAVLIIISLYSYIVLNHKNIYMNQEYPMWTSIKNKMNKNHNGKYNLLFIGDSRAKTGFIPNEFDMNELKSLNLSIGGGTPIEAYFSLKSYLEHNRENAADYLLLSYAPFHLMMQDSYWNRTVRFDFLKEFEYASILRVAEKLKDKDTLGNIENQQSDFYTGKYLVEFFRGMIFFRWKKNKEVSNHLEQFNDHYYFGRNNEASSLSQETNFIDFKPSKLLNYYFEKTLLLAEEHNIKVYYYTMPLSELSYTNTSLKFVQSYDLYIQNLSKKYKIVTLNSLTYRENSYFGDASHLYKGASIVTNDIKKKFLYTITTKK